MIMNSVTRFLIVRASGDMRVVRARPRHLAFDEVAYLVRVSVPEGWGRISPQEVSLSFPEPSPDALVIEREREEEAVL